MLIPDLPTRNKGTTLKLESMDSRETLRGRADEADHWGQPTQWHGARQAMHNRLHCTDNYMMRVKLKNLAAAFLIVLPTIDKTAR